MPVATEKNDSNKLDLLSAGSSAMKSGTAPSKRRCNTNNVNEEVLDFYFGEFLDAGAQSLFIVFSQSGGKLLAFSLRQELQSVDYEG